MGLFGGRLIVQIQPHFKQGEQTPLVRLKKLADNLGDGTAAPARFAVFKQQECSHQSRKAMMKTCDPLIP